MSSKDGILDFGKCNGEHLSTVEDGWLKAQLSFMKDQAEGKGDSTFYARGNRGFGWLNPIVELSMSRGLISSADAGKLLQALDPLNEGLPSVTIDQLEEVKEEKKKLEVGQVSFTVPPEAIDDVSKDLKFMKIFFTRADQSRGLHTYMKALFSEAYRLHLNEGHNVPKGQASFFEHMGLKYTFITNDMDTVKLLGIATT